MTPNNLSNLAKQLQKKREDADDWENDPAYEASLDMDFIEATDRGKEIVKSLIQSGSVGDISPEGGDEIALLTERSSDHVLVRKENGTVGWLCRRLDSDGVIVLNRWGNYILLAVDSTISAALASDDVCGHCKNKLRSEYM